MKEYNENRIFDNLESDEKQEFSAFSLETYIRSAAQRMIQAALELEVEEFLQRAKYDKSKVDEFRGYRGRTSSGTGCLNGGRRIDGQSSASFGQCRKVCLKISPTLSKKVPRFEQFVSETVYRRFVNQRCASLR